MDLSRQVRRVVLGYALAATGWILVSSPAAAALARRTGLALGVLEVVKGVLFVTVTSVLLAMVLSRGARQLADTERRFRVLAETVPEGLYVQRRQPDVCFEFVNPAMQQATGVGADEWYADPDVALRHVHPDDRAAVEGARADPSTARFPIVLRWRRPDGDWRAFEINETPVLDTAGRALRVQGVAVDVTHHEQREAALASALEQQRRAAAELERLQQMQRAFLQAVSHDLRTPLTVIVGLAEVLTRRVDELPAVERRRLLERLSANAERLSQLLTDLLDVDRLTRGVIEPRREAVDVAALVRRTADDLDLSRHEVSLPTGSVRGHVDPGQLARIVENLLVNALKHTPSGTPVTVTCRRLPGGVELVVEDAGPGLPEDGRDGIFEPFVRGRTHEPSPGSGIGLALVREFAHLHGGDARVEDNDDGGARFVVELPDAAEPSEEPVAASGEPAPGAS